jgi:hypothetical protein
MGGVSCVEFNYVYVGEKEVVEDVALSVSGRAESQSQLWARGYGGVKAPDI